MAGTMICAVCNQGQTRPGTATVALERGSMTLVVKAVPAQVCEICGEPYVDEATTALLLQQVAEASGSRRKAIIGEFWLRRPSASAKVDWSASFAEHVPRSTNLF